MMVLQSYQHAGPPEASTSCIASAPEPKKGTSSVQDINASQPPFGSRFLTSDSDVWSKNAWDHVPAPDDQADRIASALARQRAKPVPDDDKTKYNDKPAKHWDNFYRMNADNFFRDRKWLHTEFPELVAATRPDGGPLTIAELGCGAGNSVFPLLNSNQNPDLKLFAFDYSNHAVKLVQRNELYASPPIGTIHASVWDLTSKDGLPGCIQPSSVDIIVLVFVLSALHPAEWAQAVSNIQKMLKPGGLVVLRDYGRHDMTQLRFKEGRLLEDNLYIRGDKTRVYFFDLDDLSTLFTGSPARPEDKIHILPGYNEAETAVEDEEAITSQSPVPTPPFESNLHSPADLSTNLDSVDRSNISSSPRGEVSSDDAHASSLTQLHEPPHLLFTTEQLGVDRRLLVNRKRQLKMYRVWVQAKFRKVS